MLHKVGHGWTGRVLGFSQGDWKAVNTALAPETLALTAQLMVSGACSMEFP